MAKKNINQNVQNVLDKADVEQLRNFLEAELEHDEKMLQRFVNYANKPASKKELRDRFAASAIEDIEEAINDAEDHYGFINYHSASRFGFKIYDIMAHVQQDAPNDEVKINLQMDMLTRLDDIQIDDSDGTLSIIIDCIMEDFQRIADGKDLVSKKILFDLCMKYLENADNHMDFVVDEVEDFMLELNDVEFSERQEKYLEAKIKKLGKVKDDWKFRSNAEKYVTKMLEIKAKGGVEEKTLTDYAKPFWKSSGVRQYFVEKYIEEGRSNEAIALLEEGLKLDKEWAGLISQHREQLKELYRQTNQTAKYISMMRIMLKSSYSVDLKLFDELKSQLSPEDWEKEREEIFNIKRDNTLALAQLLKHEGLKERLAKLILGAAESSSHLLDEFAKSLPKEYVPQILAAYEKAYNKQAERANKRSDYENLIYRTIKTVHKIAGGKDLTDRLTQQWLEQYKRRPAFCEVIRKSRKM